MKYFKVVLFYRPYGVSSHVIRANDEKDALRIRDKFGISYPMNINKSKLRMKKIKCYEMDLSNDKYGLFEIILDRRRKGIGGNIWYEDENGNLQIEKL